MASSYKGIIIDQSVLEPKDIIKKAKIISDRETTLEGESFRGKVLFYNIEVVNDKLWQVLNKVAESIKSPGWYFHLVNKERLYIVMPNVILFANNNDTELNRIIGYAISQGINPRQLNLKQLFDNPFA